MQRLVVTYTIGDWVSDCETFTTPIRYESVENFLPIMKPISTA